MLKNNMEFPYPTILSVAKNYRKSNIKFKALVEVKESELNLTYNFTINSAFVIGMLETNMCKGYILIESEHSMYRNLIEVSSFNQDVDTKVAVNDIQKKITITPLLIAITNIPNFNSKEFVNNKDTYVVSRYDIIGYVEPITFYIDNYSTIFQSLANAITVRLNTTQSISFDYNLDDEMIVISVNNQKYYEKIQELNMYNKFTNTMYQSIILPVLVDALLNLNNEKYADYRWARLLQNRVEKANLNTPRTIKASYKLASKLLENPGYKMVDELINNGGINE